MMNKTFKGGRTLKGAKNTFVYLLDERVDSGTAVVIDGNPDITLAYIEQAAKKQKWSWSSGVLTFEETLTKEQINEVIIGWKRVTFPGMTEDQYDCTIVKHSDKGRTELHYIIPRIECLTGKSFNPYFVKKDFKKKDLFQDFINLKMGFSFWQDNPTVVKKAPKWSKSAKVADIRKAIDNALLPLIEENIIENRSEVILQLQEWGYELNRTGKDSISIIDQNGKNTKLKGEIYGKGFENGLSGIREKVEERKRKTSYGISRDVRSIGRELDSIVEHQAQQNRGKYRIRDRAKQETTQCEQTKAYAYSIEHRTKEPITKIQRRIDDRTRTEAISRVRSIREATSRRTRSSTDRAESYTASVITDSDTLEQGIKTWGREKYRRTLRDVLKQFVSGLPVLVRRIVVEQIKERQKKEKEALKTVPVEEVKRDPIPEKEEEVVQQPEIKSILDNESSFPGGKGPLGPG